MGHAAFQTAGTWHCGAESTARGNPTRALAAAPNSLPVPAPVAQSRSLHRDTLKLAQKDDGWG